MKKAFSLLLLLLTAFLLNYVECRCATDHVMEKYIFQGSETKRNEIYEYYKQLQELSKNKQFERDVAPTYRIPVVFHILQNANVPVVTITKVQQEVKWLNDWYSARNRYYNLSSPYWAGSIAREPDFGIEFELAAFDPAGNPSNGIVYYQNASAASNCTQSNFYQPSQGGLLLFSL